MSNKIPRHQGGAFNPRKVTAPIAAAVMAAILYTYSVTSIRAAKRNAALHREADGGQLDMRKESLRRHGVLDKVEGTGGVELFRDARATERMKESGLSEEQFMGANKAQNLTGNIAVGAGKEDGVVAGGRTEVESGLEQYKGLGKAVERFKDVKPE